MANALYDLGRQAFAEGEIDWPADDVRAVLVDLAAYTPDLATDAFLSDIPGGARAAVSGTLTGKTATAGVCDADDLTGASAFASVPAGDPLEAVVLYLHTGVDATSRLIAYIDTATGLPVTPDGNNVGVTWDNGANRIFKL